MTRTITHLDASQAMLADSAARYCNALNDDDAAARADLEAHGHRPAVYAEMASLGWVGWRVPTDHAGADLGFVEGALLHEQLGRARRLEPLLDVSVAAVETLRRCPPSTIRDTLLADVAAGRAKVALAWRTAGEATPGSVSRSAESTTIDAHLEHVSPADADTFLVVIGDALCRVPRDRAGVTVTTRRRIDGGLWATLTLDGVSLQSPDRLCEHGAAARDAALDAARVMTAAELLGLMQAGFDETLAHLRLREQFGAPIGSFQALQHRAADLLARVELSRSAVERAARAFDASDDPGMRAREASAVLARCADAATQVLEACIQLHGGIGYTDDAAIGRRLKRAMVLGAWLGTARQQRARYGALVRPTGVAGNERARPGAPSDVDLGFSPDEVRDVVERAYPRALRELGRRATWREAADWHRTLHARGWAAPAWPNAFGGMGLSAYAQVAWADQLDRGGVDVVPNVGIAMLGPLLIRHGTPAQQAEHLPPMLAGDVYWCQGYSEPGAGSDLASLRTTARRDGDAFVVDGQKLWTSLAHEADMMFLLARTDPSASKHAGISFLLVDMKSPGITVTPIRNLAGTSEFCQVFLDGVRVPARNLVGPLHGGWRIATSLLGSERIALGSPRYVKKPLAALGRLAIERHAFDDPLFADRYAAHHLAVDDIEALYVRVIDALRRGEDVSAETSLLKLVVTETWQRIASDVRDLAGLDATTAAPIDLPSGRVAATYDYLVSRSSTIYGGTSEIQRNVLAKAWLDLPGARRAG